MSLVQNIMEGIVNASIYFQACLPLFEVCSHASFLVGEMWMDYLHQDIISCNFMLALMLWKVWD